MLFFVFKVVRSDFTTRHRFFGAGPPIKFLSHTTVRIHLYLHEFRLPQILLWSGETNYACYAISNIYIFQVLCREYQRHLYQSQRQVSELELGLNTLTNELKQSGKEFP